MSLSNINLVIVHDVVDVRVDVIVIVVIVVEGAIVERWDCLLLSSTYCDKLLKV